MCPTAILTGTKKKIIEQDWLIFCNFNYSLK